MYWNGPAATFIVSSQGMIIMTLGGKKLKVGSISEVIVERKKLLFSCFDRKWRQMCFLTIFSLENLLFIDLKVTHISA